MLDVSELQEILPELLLLCAIVAIAAQYLRIPYTTALAVAGVGVGSLYGFHPPLSRDLILLAFLPPLLFEGSLNIELLQLVRHWKHIALLAVPGTLVAAGTVALGLHLVVGMAWSHAMLAGVIVASTDPVSVLATMKEHGISGGLRAILEGESIFNDVVGILLFSLALTWAFPGAHERHGIFETAAELVAEVGVGAGVGVGVGLLLHRLMATVNDHLIETTLSIVCCYGSYVLAHSLHGSGVIAVVVSALLIGNYGVHVSMSKQSRARLTEFWEVIAFLVNSAVFVLIGLAFEFSSLRDWTLLGAVAVVAIALLAGRVLVIAGILWPSALRLDREKFPRRWLPAVYWGGLRGSIPIALVLGLAPAERTVAGINLVTLVFSVVLLSLIGQGLTFGPLLSRLGLGAGSSVTADPASATE